MLELRGVCWRLLGEHFGALGAASGPLGSAPGTIFGPFCDVCGRDFGVYFSRAVVPGIELDLVLFLNFFGFSGLSKNSAHRSHIVNTNGFATCSVAV